MIFNDDRKMGGRGMLGVPVSSHASGFTRHDVTATSCVHDFGNVSNGIRGAAPAMDACARAASGARSYSTYSTYSTCGASRSTARSAVSNGVA